MAVRWWLILFGLNAVTQLAAVFVLQFYRVSSVIVELHFCEFAIWTVGWAILNEMSKWRKL